LIVCRGEFAVLDQDKKLRDSTKTPVVPILAGILTVATVGGALIYLQQANQGDSTVVLTDAARAYLPSLNLDNVSMQAREDALGQTLLEITGDITNLGQSEVAVVEANCVFRDVNGIELERQRSALVNERTGPLHPGETQSFRLAFDTVPDGWNQVVPDLFIAQIQFSE
jgi:hypothetical protein